MATYISNQTGNWSSKSTWLTAAIGTFSPTALAGNAPVSFGGDKIVIKQGHTVTYDVSGCFGDGGVGNTPGTTIQNITAASIILSGGALRASRTQSTSLTAVGVIWVGGDNTTTSGSNFDWGTKNDPISAVTSTIQLSCAWHGGSIINVKGSSSSLVFSNSATFWGQEKTRNTFLTLSAAAGSNQITVDSTYNWKLNDELVIESDTNDVTRCLSGVKIQSIAGNTITINPTLNFARLSGTRVGNFSSTVTFKTLDALTGLACGLYSAGMAQSVLQFGYTSFENFSPTWYKGPTATAIDQMIVANSVLSLNPQYSVTMPIFKGLAYQQTKTPSTTHSFISLNNSSADTIYIEDIAANTSHTISNLRPFGAYAYSNSIFNNCVLYKGYVGFWCNNQYNCVVTNSYFNSFFVGAGGVAASNGLYATFNNCKFRCTDSLFYQDNLLSMTFNNCDVTSLSGRGITQTTAGAYGTTTLINCTISGVSANTYTIHNPANLTIKDANINVFNPNNSDTYLSFNTFHYAESNSTVRKNGIASYAIRPKLANTSFMKIFTTPAIRGVSQRIKGNLRFDSGYTTTTPPSILFTGAVADYTFTCPAVANTWYPFDVILNPNITGNIEIKISGQSSTVTTASGSGYVYVDGLLFDPFVRDVRFYGFNFEKSINRTINPLNTLTESQVSTLSAVSTLDHLYDASLYWSVSNPSISAYVDLVDVNGTILDFMDSNIVVDANASNALSYDINTNIITVKSSTLSGSKHFDTIITTGYLSAVHESHIQNNVTLRTSNYDSELVYGGADNIVLYPTLLDAQSSTNPGPSANDGVLRFLYGETIQNVALSGSVYIKWTAGAYSDLYIGTVSQGRNELGDLSNQAGLAIAISNMSILNQGVQKASLMIPHLADTAAPTGLTVQVQTLVNDQQIVNDGIKKVSKMVPHTTSL